MMKRTLAQAPVLLPEVESEGRALRWPPSQVPRGPLGIIPTAPSHRGETSLQVGHQPASYPLPLITGMHCQPVDVAPPTVEAADDRPDDASLLSSDEHYRRAAVGSAPNIVEGVGNADGRVSLSPQGQDDLQLIVATLSHRDVTSHAFLQPGYPSVDPVPPSISSSGLRRPLSLALAAR